MLRFIALLSCAAASNAFSTGLPAPALRPASSACTGWKMMAQGPTRREVLISAAGAAAAAALPASDVRAEEKPGAFSLPPLPYDYKALEPYIDEETMKFHHDKHFNAYLKNLNKAMDGKTVPALTDIQKTAIKSGSGIRNNGGGFYNHGLFFSSMCPAKDSGSPSPALAKAIDDSFGSMDKMKEEFNGAAAKRFGSGWAWLGVSPDGKLVISSTPNQDNPLMEGAEGAKMIPFLGLDVWEHAYYLKYQNLRPKYIEAWWNVVNWKQVSEYYEVAKSGKPVTWA